MTPSLAFADMLADARLAVVMHKDDSYYPDYTEVFPNVRDLTTSDNAGGTIPVGYGFATIAAAPTQNLHHTPERNGQPGSSTTWPEYREIYSYYQFAPVNHSQNHDNKLGTWLLEFQAGHETIVRETGRVPSTMVVVAGIAGQVQPSIQDMSYDLALSGNYNNTGAGIYQPDIFWGEEINMTTYAKPYVVSSRWAMDGQLSLANFGDLSGWRDRHITIAKTKKHAAPIFGHNPFVGGGANLRLYIQSIIAKAAEAGVALWMPNPQQLADYRRQKRLATVGAPIVSGNSVTWEVELADCFYQDLSYLVPGAESVTVQGARNATFNSSTGLLNVYKLQGEGVLPVEETPKPRLSGEIPVYADMEIISEQAPATDYFSRAYDPATIINENRTFYYGKFRTADNQLLSYSRHRFRKGQNPVIKQITVGDNRPNVGFDLRIFEVKKDGTQRELLQYTGGTPTTRTIEPTAPDSTLRYQLIGANSPSQLRLLGEYTDVAYPALPAREKYGFENFTLVHAHDYELMNQQGINWPVYNLWKALGGGRVYKDAKRITTEEGRYIFNIDAAGNDQDELMQQIHTDNLATVLDVKEVPEWLYNKYTQADRDATQGTREWPPVNPPYANRLTMEAWAWARDLAYQIVARYGSNKNLDPATVKARTDQLYPGNPDIVYTKEIGLGTLKILEIWNEADKDWKGIKVYTSGAEYAYMAYSIWLGVQDADPTVQVSCTGLAGATPDWLMDCAETMAKIAPLNADGSPLIPWDYLQVHAYSNSGSGQQNTNEKTRAMMPEISSLGASLDRLQEANARFLGNKPLIMGEIGSCWKINYVNNDNVNVHEVQSPYLVYPPVGSNYTQKEWQAVHYLRTAFYLHKRGGFKYAVHYQLTDDSPATPYQNYSTMGVLETVTVNGVNTVQYRPNGNLLVQARQLLTGYRHAEQVSPLVDRLQNAAGRNALVVCSKTENNTQVAVEIPLSGTATRYDFSLHSTTPTATQVPAGLYNTIAAELPFVLILN
ncbi:hypothetical protein [Hymenobacter mucosus]|uniref:hypothetical protein n=1 Tax=Hymenobacter mucosus TaxID=1411120 RepID=UPI00117B1D63|nr:hypothetical protein [Hymenobacter mucosus]